MTRYQPMESIAESRNSSLNLDDDDERDLPELREGSEPLDLLRWELEALKLEQDMDGKSEQSKTYSWSCMEDAAEMEKVVCLPTKKPGPMSPQDDRPLGFDTIAKKETVSIQANVGSEDNPILASNSLDNASNRLAKNNKAKGAVEPPGKTTKKGTVEAPPPPAKKAPPPHHSRPPLPPSKWVGAPPPSALPQKSQADSSSNDKAKSGSEKADTSGRFQPIISVDEPGNYLEPIIVHSASGGTSPAEYNTDSRVESAFKQVRSSTGVYSIDALVSDRKQEYQEKIVSPCKNSSLIKSAYHHLNKKEGEGPNWPDELSVDPQDRDDRSSLVATPVFDNTTSVVLDIVDLSQVDDNDQLDADELEAEYARLVGEEGAQDSPALSETISAEVCETEDESLVYSPGAATPREKDGEISQGFSLSRSPKPLDELRNKTSMVGALSGSDTKSGEDLHAKEPPRRFVPLPEHPRGVQGRQWINHVRDETREFVLRDPSGQEEPPETRQSESVDRMQSASSTYDSQEADDDDELNDEDRSFTMSEKGENYYFDTPISQDVASVGSKRKLDYDIPFLESVVAEYFGAGKKDITRSAKAGLKDSLFSTAGGCCMPFH